MLNTKQKIVNRQAIDILANIQLNTMALSIAARNGDTARVNVLIDRIIDLYVCINGTQYCKALAELESVSNVVQFKKAS